MTTSSSSINLEAAAHEAALADGIISSSLSDNSKINDTISKTKKAGLRRGKWTAEEESYANRLISEFKMGLLPLTDGTTLRTFLSKLLNCDPMRISKKFVGGNCIGKVNIATKCVKWQNENFPIDDRKYWVEIGPLIFTLYFWMDNMRSSKTQMICNYMVEILIFMSIYFTFSASIPKKGRWTREPHRGTDWEK